MTATTTTNPAVARDLLATGASVGLARTVVSSFVHSLGLDRYEERALAIVSELMANAVAVSGPTDTVRVYVTLHPGRLWMGISDTAPERGPVPRHAVSALEQIDDAESETFGGWGLMLVAAHADDVWIPRDLLAVDAGTERWGAAFTGGQAPGRATISLEKLAEHPLVVPTVGSSMRAGVDELFARARLTPEVVAECTDIHMLLSLVTCGVGAALLPDSLARTRSDLSYRMLTPPVTHTLSVVRRAGSTTPSIDSFCAVAAAPKRSRRRDT